MKLIDSGNSTFTLTCNMLLVTGPKSEENLLIIVFWGIQIRTDNHN